MRETSTGRPNDSVKNVVVHEQDVCTCPIFLNRKKLVPVYERGKHTSYSRIEVELVDDLEQTHQSNYKRQDQQYSGLRCQQHALNWEKCPGFRFNPPDP